MLWRGITSKLQKIFPIAKHKSNVTFNGIQVHQRKVSLHHLTIKDLKQLFASCQYTKVNYKNETYYNSLFGRIEKQYWKKIYMLPHLLPVDNKIKEMQYKILFRFIATKKYLFQIKIASTPNCPLCYVHTHTMEHLFFECPTSKTFWLKLSEIWNFNNGDNVKLKLSDIIFGYKLGKLEENIALNTIILLAKYYLYRGYINEEKININNFKQRIARYVETFGSLKNKKNVSVVIKVQNSMLN